MNELEPTQLDDAVSAPFVGRTNSAGSLLRAAREAQGLPIDALAAALKVSVKKLQALESDRFDVLLDVVFVRALAASVCRTLKIDPSPILDSLPNSSSVHLSTKAPAMSVPFRVPRGQSGHPLRDQFSKPLIVVVLLLLAGGLVLLFAPIPQLAGLGGAVSSDVVVEPGPTSPLTGAAAMPAQLSSTPLTVANAVSSVQGGSQARGTPLKASPEQPLSVAVPTESASGAVIDLVVFTARGASWVEVVDATASVRLRKTLASGDVVNATGVAPLSVVVGRADVVDVQLRGKPFDLIPIARENVARFEVK